MIPVSILLPYKYTLAKNKVITDLKDILLPGYFDTVAGRKELFKSAHLSVSFFTNIMGYWYIITIGIFLILSIL